MFKLKLCFKVLVEFLVEALVRMLHELPMGPLGPVGCIYNVLASRVRNATATILPKSLGAAKHCCSPARPQDLSQTPMHLDSLQPKLAKVET